MANRAILIGHLFDDVGIDESTQSVGEEVLCNSQIFLDSRKAAHSPKQISQDEQRPAIADEIKRAAGVVDVVEALPMAARYGIVVALSAAATAIVAGGALDVKMGA